MSGGGAAEPAISIDRTLRRYTSRYGESSRAANSPAWSRARPSISVLNKPGSMIETRTPKPATSIRSTSDSASRKNFDAWYHPLSG